MGRRVKSIVALLMVLCLLYWQQDQISYATEEEGNTGNEQENPEEKPVVEKYELSVPGEDGQNGYYVSYPEIEVRHISEAGATWCRLENGDGEVIEQVLEEKGASAVLGPEQLREGKNNLMVWMTDEEGTELEEYRFQRTLWIDTAAPEITLDTLKGTEVWYDAGTDLSVAADDGKDGSQVAEISCYANGEAVGWTDQSRAVFRIETFSSGARPVDVEIYAVDLAGNRAFRECGLYIDGEAPEVSITGVQDYMITSQPVELHFAAREENVFRTVLGTVDWEAPDGGVKQRTVESWTDTAEGKTGRVALEEDGSYQVRMEAADGAGHIASAARRFTIDRHNPVIRYIDELDGTYQKSFRLDHTYGELIQDFTTVTCTVTLDGQLYPLGKHVIREGLHILELKAVDSAGNVGTAKAEFVIDHTAPEIVFKDLKEGEAYEETHTFQVTVSDQNDTIQEIRINGIRQATSGHSKIYQYTAEEEKSYEVSVKAVDRAGNQTVERISFEIVPKATLAEQILKPIQETLGMETKSGEPETDKGTEPKGNDSMKGWKIALGAGMGVLAAGSAGWVFRKRKQKL